MIVALVWEGGAMAGFFTAARTPVASNSYDVLRQNLLAGQWQHQQPHQQVRCQAAVAAVAAALPDARRQACPQQQHQQQLALRRHLHRRCRLPVCNSFNLPDGLGENLRRLRGSTQRPPQQGQSSVAGSGSNLGGAEGSSEQPSVWSDWQADATSQDWEDWEGLNVADLDDISEVAELREAVIERRRLRGGRRRNVRDEYIRPIVDAQGIVNRLAVDEAEVEERVFVEAITNQYESREAVKYAGTLVVVPLLVGFFVSRMVAQPVWSYAEGMDSNAFAPSDIQKVEGAHDLHVEELRLRMEASLGMSPPLSDEQVYEELHSAALRLDQQFREVNKRSMLNAVADLTFASVFFIMLARQVPQRQILFRTIGRVFTGLSDTAKAFLIILTTDILLGYHSEEGWTAFLRLFSGHYGLEAEDESLKIFVATVPVFFDSLFKVWIFIGLNKQDPAAAVTLKQMDRH